MSARNAIVVGGTGDIGKAVVDRLRVEGLRVVCASNRMKRIRLLPPQGGL